MTKIFISYRRTAYIDGGWKKLDTNFVGRLRKDLTRTYGDDAVFRDIDDIKAGQHFLPVIEAALAECSVLLVVITPIWVDVQNDKGGRRLDESDDYVRTEVALGLARSDVMVIPVLAEGAEMPRKEQLPESLQPLTDIEAARLADDTYEENYEKLVRDIGGRRGILRFLPAMIAVVLLVALVAGVVLVRGSDASNSGAAGPATTVPPSSGGPLAPMSSDTFNVAVADFATSDPADDAVAHQLATAFSDRLRTTLSGDPGMNVRVMGVDEVGRLRGDTAADRTVAAGELAAGTNASVVIGAALADRTVQPTATLNPRDLTTDPALSGNWTLAAVPYGGSITNPLVANKLVGNLDASALAVADFVRGIYYYEVLDGDGSPGSAATNQASAHDAFTRALDSHKLTPAGEAAAHTFLGSLALVQGLIDEAEPQYTVAAVLDPTSTRAQLGLAEVKFQRSTGVGCAAGTVDPKGLADAATAFRAVTPRSSDAPGTPEKVELGEARALRCLSQAGGADAFATVEDTLRGVITASGDDPNLTELVAVAHAELALVLAPEAGATTPASFQPALDETEEALRITQREHNKTAFLWQEAFYLKQQGRVSEAEAVLAQVPGIDKTTLALAVDDLAATPTGRVVPMRVTTVTVAAGQAQAAPTLAFTGQDVLPEVVLGLALLGLGFLLTLVAGKRRFT